MADDFSDDGTWKWMQKIAEKDQNVKIHRNSGPTRLGHTILYDTLVKMASNDIITNVQKNLLAQVHFSSRIQIIKVIVF